ncbi:MAG: formamidopyrimidine-DNA glycosylase [Frankiales bacterium]|nr:formamidopyrimidine-DNA glycosylase [Frankiales bacterium]
MPELPEVETARAVIAERALDRLIVDVDDSDRYECRPHAPGEIRQALLGRRLTSANRRGKSMWCETSGVGRCGEPGPPLGIHLGMAGRIFISDADGDEASGGDPVHGNGTAAIWTRFSLTFADGGRLRLFDKRRLGRVRLDPDILGLGPDALGISPPQFRTALARGTAPVKARLLDQSAIAGVGNLLADETLWQGRVWPGRRVQDLLPADVDRLYRALNRSLTSAIANGGVHTGRVINARRSDGRCPRCHAAMARATIGGRTTWWCTVEQAA